MNIAIIHGSPKGDFSTTKQYTDYLKKHIPQHTYNQVFVGKEIKKEINNECRINRFNQL